jgi:hypothetical protein
MLKRKGKRQGESGEASSRLVPFSRVILLWYSLRC